MPTFSLAVPASTYLLLLAVSISPLVQEPVPPLVDYLSHLGRLYLLASPSAFYETRWAFLPNLAMDATVTALAPPSASASRCLDSRSGLA